MNYLFITKIVQLILALVLTLLVLIQGKGTGLSSAFSGMTSFYRTKRGVDKVVFIMTIFSGVLLVVNSMFIVLLS